MKKEGRRSFMGTLGKLMAAAPLVAVPIETKPRETAFRFQCDCGADILAEVPKEICVISVECPECKQTHVLNWQGTHFKFKGSSGTAENALPNKPSLEHGGVAQQMWDEAELRRKKGKLAP